MAKPKNLFTSIYTNTYCDSIPAFQRASPLMFPQIYLELIDRSVNSEKFYKVSINPVTSKIITQYGRLGTRGSFIEQGCNTDELNKVVKVLTQKLKKGYVEQHRHPAGDIFTLSEDIKDILEPCTISYMNNIVNVYDLQSNLILSLPRTFGDSEKLINFITFNYAKKVS
jgi:predicted DNA-binding WGR domain protein